MAANRGAKIILHSLERSRSQRILWLLEELNLSYEIRPYKRGLHERAPPELKSIHPLGKAPILEIQHPSLGRNGGNTVSGSDGGNSTVLAESAAIMEHLLENFTWRRYWYYMHYAEGSLMPLVVTNILMDVVQSAPPFFLKPFLGIIPGIVKKEYCQPNFSTHLGFLEEQLAKTPTDSVGKGKEDKYLAGTQFTAADILMSYPLIILEEVNVLVKERYPVLSDYVKRLRVMDGYQKAVQILEEVEGQEYKVF
ncbi:hypothetical protein BJX63DRAFT_417316 [Aspergillus granulosus]|uniref:Glutathione S-transferase n=1 Tax=Aspergillus granulosus TaxID=176169 RepID=A0ABR4I556_9EURO